MSTLATEAQANAVRFDADTMWVDLEDGRQMGVPLAYFRRLLNATPAQRENPTKSRTVAWFMEPTTRSKCVEAESISGCGVFND